MTRGPDGKRDYDVDEAGGRQQAVETELRDPLTIEPLRSRVDRLRPFLGRALRLRQRGAPAAVIDQA